MVLCSGFGLGCLYEVSQVGWRIGVDRRAPAEGLKLFLFLNRYSNCSLCCVCVCVSVCSTVVNVSIVSICYALCLPHFDKNNSCEFTNIILNIHRVFYLTIFHRLDLFFFFSLTSCIFTRLLVICIWYWARDCCCCRCLWGTPWRRSSISSRRWRREVYQNRISWMWPWGQKCVWSSLYLNE